VRPQQDNHLLPCVVPFAIYLAGSAWITKVPTYWYWLAYLCVAALSATSFWCLSSPAFRSAYLKPHRRVLEGVTLGAVGILAWIVLSHLRLEAVIATYLPSWLTPAERAGFNPWEQLSGPLAIGLFLTIRIIGIAVVVPLVEELFWRAFLLRWTIDPDWEQVPLGAFTWRSCLTVVVLFTLAHPEWFAAATYCLLINSLLYWKKDLWQCIVAHSVSNFLLVIYVITTDNWWLW
jgi:uncharacterized protein